MKDIEASKQFYEKLGFEVFAGDQSKNWLVLKNGDHAIGLFQGMFDKNILTFNPALQGLRMWTLATKDAQEFYRPFRFKELSSPEKWMELFTG